MSGTKTLVNGSRNPIEVTLIGRKGSDPNGGDLPPVTVSIPAGGTVPNVQYGNDQNPYLNAVSVTTGDSDSKSAENLRVVQRGGPGTLDNRLNAFSVFKIVADPDQAAFSLESSN
ncbi:MAG TPA: hypothetical protein VHG91_03025 [Longimicrobium sp.]|nr:hypothetical protein [Longimicrobium sp.]